ncbi:MAG: S41 family peptidase [Planctomycetota bacterium]
MDRRRNRGRGGWARQGLVVVLGLAVVFSGASVALSAWRARSGDAAAFAEVLGIVSSVHVDQPEPGELAQAAIGGMVASLEDPYSVFVPAERVAAFEKELTGSYSGIGASIEMRDGWLTIVSPLEDSPAYRAGLLPGDRIEAVDGDSTEGITADGAVARLTGEEGTQVVLTVSRLMAEPVPETVADGGGSAEGSDVGAGVGGSGVGGRGEPFEVVIVRAPIVSRTVKGVRRDPADPEAWVFTLDSARGIGYVRVTQFTPSTVEAFDAAIAEMVDAGLAGVIVDVRGNPGGLMDAAVRMVDRVLNDGLIVSASGPAAGSSRREASASATVFDGEVVVLIDGQSASAAEIFAGAIVGNGRGVALGTRTFGKGSVQGVFNLTDGSELKLTQAWYRVADGSGGQEQTAGGGSRAVDRAAGEGGRWGVDPSAGMYVPMSRASLIAARDAMVELDRLGGGSAVRAIAEAGGESGGTSAGEPWDVEAVLDRRADPQLRAAHGAMVERLETGEWGRPGRDPPGSDDLRAQEARGMERERGLLIARLAELDARLAELSADTEEPDGEPAGGAD